MSTISQKTLKKAADELNEVLGLDPAIDSSLKVVALLPLVKKAISLTTEDDEFSEETQELIDTLREEPEEEIEEKPAKKETKTTPKKEVKKVAKPVAKVEEPEDDDEDAQDDDQEDIPEEKPAKKETKTTPKKEVKKSNFSRSEAIALALQNTKPKSFEDWAKNANKINIEHGGRDNVKESLNMIKMIHRAFIALGMEVPSK